MNSPRGILKLSVAVAITLVTTTTTTHRHADAKVPRVPFAGTTTITVNSASFHGGRIANVDAGQ